MLLAMLLLAHARAEWVEITQLRPDKTRPLDTTATRQDSVEFHDIPGPGKNAQSLEHDRRKPLFTEEFHDERSKVHFSTAPHDKKRFTTETGHYDKRKRLPIEFSTEPGFLHDSRNDFHEERPNEKFSNVPYDIYGEKFNHFTTETGQYDDNRKPVQFSTEPGFLADYKRNRIYINHTIDHSTEKYWSKGVVHRVPNPTIGSNKRIYVTTEPAKVKYEETDLTHELQGYTIRNPFKAYIDQTPEFITKEESFEDDGEDELRFVRKPEDIWGKGDESNLKNNPKSYSPVRRVDTEENDPLTTNTPAKPPKKDHSEKPPESAKVNSMENVLKLVKVVADTISKNTRRSVGSKLRYLEDLKETIMTNIEDRIEALWPDDSGAGAARRRRWARAAQARGHVEFPSSESALMTISFLTFAVYLIKLVLQVIQTYKNKTMMVTPAVFAAVGRAANGNRQAPP